MSRYHSARFRPGAAAAAALLVTVSSFSAVRAIQAPSASPKPVPVVAPAALEALLPSLEGWTKDRVTSDRITASESCSYALADVIFRNGPARVRVVLADTGFDSDALAALATIVVTFPAGHSEVIPPDTVVTRGEFKGSPSATLWASAKQEGEVTVVVGGRYVAKIEGRNVEGLDRLQAILGQIDLKKLAGLDAR